MCKTRPVRPGRRNKSANWPRLAEAGGHPELDLALAGELAEASVFHIAVCIIATSLNRVSERPLRTVTPRNMLADCVGFSVE